MISYRLPTAPEKRLLRALIERIEDPHSLLQQLDSMMVAPMDDGGMGSLRVCMPDQTSAKRAFKSQASELEFTDADGAIVIVSLYVAEDGRPLEIDVWKTTFEPVVKIPSEFRDVSYQSGPDPSGRRAERGE